VKVFGRSDAMTPAPTPMMTAMIIA